MDPIKKIKIFQDEKELDLEEEFGALLQGVNLSLISDDNTIKDNVLPICSVIFGHYWEDFHKNEEVPYGSLREMIGLVVIGFVLSSWLTDGGYRMEIVEEVPDVEDVVDFAETLINKITETIDMLQTNAAVELERQLDLEDGSLTSLEFKEILDAIRRKMVESSDRDDG